MANLKTNGVSEAIGYVILLGIVFTGIGLVTLYGYPILMQQESLANMRNMERTMIVIQNDIKSLMYSLESFRETDFQVGGGPIILRNSSVTSQTFDISWTTPMGTPQPTGMVSLGEIRYFSTKDNAYVAFENGAVIEKYAGQNATLLARPRWYITKSADGSTTMVVNLVNITSTGKLTSVNGAGSLRSNYLSTTITTVGSSTAVVGSIIITYRPDSSTSSFGYAQAWRTYLTDPSGLGLVEFPAGSNQYILPPGVTVNTLVVKQYSIDVEMG